MPVLGKDVLARNILKFGGGFLNHVNKTMKGVHAMMDEEITKNMSLQDHSLKDLADLGHPYAARHGAHGMPIHDPYWQVHVQSGQLLESKKGGTTEASMEGGALSAKAWVGLDEHVAEHAVFVVFGTSKMIPRDFLAGSVEIKKKDIYAYLKANLRDFVFSFRGERTSR